MPYDMMRLEEFNMDISKKIKAVRVNKHMTQQKFADQLGVTRGYITNVESGKAKPTQLMINCISSMYGIDKNWFLDSDNCDMGVLEHSSDDVVMEKYGKLKGDYKVIAEKHIEILLELQEKNENHLD